MNRKELTVFFEETTQKMIETMKKKNADYSGSRDEEYAFANFDSVQHIGLCSAEVGLMTRMMDKVTRVSGFIRKGVLEVKDESIEDTLIDLSNYSLLLAAYIKSKKEKAKQDPSLFTQFLDEELERHK